MSASPPETNVQIVRRRAIMLAALALASPHNVNAADNTTNIPAIPEDNLAYPVLITMKNGDTGSGFFLNAADATFLVTAKHVLADPVLFDPATQVYRADAAIEILSYSKDFSDTKRNRLTLDLSNLQKIGYIKFAASEDIALVKIGSFRDNKITFAPGIIPIEFTDLGIVGASVEGAKKFGEILIGNDVVMYGYPTSLAFKPLSQIDADHPLLRKGIVAGKSTRTHTIVLDCPSYPGNSGGPVFEIDREVFAIKFRLIGVVTQFVPFAQTSQTFSIFNNSGYSIAAPIDAVLELIK